MWINVKINLKEFYKIKNIKKIQIYKLEIIV